MVLVAELVATAPEDLEMVRMEQTTISQPEDLAVGLETIRQAAVLEAVDTDMEAAEVAEVAEALQRHTTPEAAEAAALAMAQQASRQVGR